MLLIYFANMEVSWRWLCVCALLGVVVVRSQDLHFQHITTEDGLSDNAITCLFEDRTGYIWIGTERGLNRYDGQRVERCEPGASGPLGAHITGIAEDRKGRLWFSTADAGLSMRDTSGVFTHFRKDSTDAHALPTNNLNDVLVIDDSLLVLSSRGWGAIWYHLRKGVVQRRGFRPRLINTEGDTAFSFEDNWCHTALLLKDGRLWLAMLRNTGSYVVDAYSGELSTLLPSVGLVTNAVEVDGALFIGGWKPGMTRVGLGHQGTVSDFPLEEEIKAIVQWDEERLLAATKVNGLLWLNKDGTVLGRSQHVRSEPSSLKSDRTTCLLRDRAKNLWVGTGNGVSVHAPSVWGCDAIPLLPDDHEGDLVFHGIQQDDDGTIRLSTSKGFIVVDPVRRTHRIIELTNAGVPLEVTGLYRTGQEEWFVGTETGIFRYDPRHERILLERESGKWSSYHDGNMFQTRAVWATSVEGRELLLVGALGYGHVPVDRISGEWVKDWTDHQDAEGTLMLRSTLRDSHGTYWSATSGGVVRWTPGGFGGVSPGTIFSTRVDVPHRLPGNDAQALVLQGDTTWVALRDAGLASIVGDQVRAHPAPGHFPHDVLGVTVAHDGNVWCTTSQGLMRYSPPSDAWLYVHVNDGRTFRQLTKCITTLRDGRIAVCADDHLLLLDPTLYDVLPELPVPRMTAIDNTWGALLTDAHGELELPYRNSSFDAMLTALQPVGVTPLTFLCRLDDEGSSQHEVTAREPLRYAGVSVGTHRLLVRVRDAYGREGPEHVLLTVSVIGPFWQRWWFFVLVLAAGALAMYLVSRFRQKQRAKLQHVRDRIARDLHDDIGSTLGSISFYSEALKRKLGDTDDAMAQQVAEKIGSSSRDMIDQMSDIVWSVDPKNDDAAALVTRLQAFASDLLAARRIALHFHADAAINERKLTADQRRNIFLICKEVLHNTLKYADARSVTITMGSTGRALELVIEDDGKGFDPENTDSYNGNGLPNMRVRAEAIGAVFTVTSAPGKGTRARIVLPQNALPRSGD